MPSILAQGVLQKPKGLPGLRSWQKHHFVLTPSALEYELQKGCAARAAIPLVEIEAVKPARDACRLDIVLRGGQVFPLKALKPVDAVHWQQRLQGTCRPGRLDGPAKALAARAP